MDASTREGLEAVREEHGAGLAALGGRRLTGFALVRFVEDGDWFADCPVVLDFDGVQAEICHWKFDELSISWNSIDTTAAISGWEYVEQTPAWSDADERLESFVGQELREVALLEWRPSSRHDLADGTLAVEFVFGAGRFHLANALDENSIDVGDAHPDFVRHRLGRGADLPGRGTGGGGNVSEPAEQPVQGIRLPRSPIG
ncbi:hypothetical protein ACWGH8_26525 [Nonomuraea muscovyensis]|uniref:Uncharacterized protein n=1 Tax=Nonomuraea muscovyensis TaxID=1124761 RepID=A0A7X0C3K8_9ACTN|nr:hypothetical protein [Nonomuraea muscovyensis]MBB6347874.1 hypothetical protein [Nonomuraea muscovyensis]